MIRVSIGTAELLGLNHTMSQVLPTTAYLMKGEHCSNNCSFCTQAKDSAGSLSRLSRVTWPEYSLDEVLERLAVVFERGLVKRICIQVVQCDDSKATLIRTISKIKGRLPDVPLSISVALNSLDSIAEVLKAGAEQVNLSLDGASQSVFEGVKKRRWDAVWSQLTDAAGAFPGRIRTHLIVGLGEQERDITETVQRCSDMGIGVGLFAFTPVKGTPLEDKPQPPLKSYRRLQAAVWLIEHQLARAEQFSYDCRGGIKDFGISQDLLEEIFSTGTAFETSGCPDCNRPYYNESPRQTPYNYPRPLTQAEIKQAVEAVVAELNTV